MTSSNTEINLIIGSCNVVHFLSSLAQLVCNSTRCNCSMPVYSEMLQLSHFIIEQYINELDMCLVQINVRAKETDTGSTKT